MIRPARALAIVLILVSVATVVILVSAHWVSAPALDIALWI